MGRRLFPVHRSPPGAAVRRALNGAFFVWAAATAFAAPASPDVRTLRLVHLNDTHGFLDGADVTFSPSGSNELRARAGGAARVATLVKSLRDRTPSIFLHAGDVFTGTAFFSAHLGRADAAAFGAMGLDVLTFGNHEFDRGPAVLDGFLTALRPETRVVSANIGRGPPFPSVWNRVRPYALLERGRLRVAVFGLTTTETPSISSPGPAFRFEDAARAADGILPAIRRETPDLVIALTHLGIDEDRRLAAACPWIDVIVGGHSHTLLGDDSALGFRTEGAYPEVIRQGDRVTLIVTAWSRFRALGVLDLDVAGASRLVAWRGGPLIPLDEDAAGGGTNGTRRRTAADAAVDRALAPFRASLDALERRVVTVAPRSFWHVKEAGAVHPVAGVLAGGSDLAPLVAEILLEDVRMRDATVDAALVNTGGIRTDLPAGPLSLGKIREILPFGNTLVTLTLTRAEWETTLTRGRTGKHRLVHAGGAPPGTGPVRVVTWSYLAGGGDGFLELKNAAGPRTDTGRPDADVFAEGLVRRWGPAGAAVKP